jgi:E3 ubiquitin-protein ligase FANCL
MQFLGPPETIYGYRIKIAGSASKWYDTDQSFCHLNPFYDILKASNHYRSLQNSICDNLETLLCLEFPKKHSKNVEIFTVECGICYTYAISVTGEDPLDQLMTGGATASAAIPEHTCSNEKCGKSYHYSCLLDWLQSLPSSRTSFGTTFGSCPYCSEAISVKSFR